VSERTLPQPKVTTAQLSATYIRGYQAALRGGAAHLLLEPDASPEAQMIERAWRGGFHDGLADVGARLSYLQTRVRLGVA